MNATGSVLAAVAGAVTAIERPHPLRVGVDGKSAAGKTTFADSLRDALTARGRDVIRAELDDFHRPGHKWRSIRREWTPQSYYDDGYDYHAFVEVLLEPLGRRPASADRHL